MTDMFAIHGIALDPSDLEHAIEKIIKVVGSSGGVCDGERTFDVFVNYRVAADADVAEKLYLYLKTKGINAFLDKKCLRAGEPWKEGFLSGLSRSRVFLCLISSPALANVRDKTKNHEGDNVLLEYETALMIQRQLAEVDVDLARNYIVPVHVGQCSQGVLTKFTDFNPMMYPDSVGPESDDGGSNVDTASNITTPTAIVMDLTTCEGTIAALQIPSLGPADAEAALKAIGNLCHDQESVVKLSLLGACEVAVKALLSYSTTNAFVAAQGCYTVRCLASGVNNPDHRKDKLVAAGAIEGTINALRAFPMNAEVVEQGCNAIYKLAGSDDREDKLVGGGAIDVVIKALRTFPENPEIVDVGIMAISNLSLGSCDKKDMLVTAGAIEEVIKALRAYPTNVEIVRRGCEAIYYLAGVNGAVGNDYRSDKLVAAGAVGEVMKAMRAYPENAGVIERGCMAIVNLAGDERSDNLVAAGAVDEVIKALRAFPENAELVRKASMALGNLASGSIDRKDKLVAAGAKPLVEAALNNDVLTPKARDAAKYALDRLD